MANRYFCKVYGSDIEITREQYIRAERSAGFRPKQGDGVATCGFSNNEDVSYRTEHVPGTSIYDDD